MYRPPSLSSDLSLYSSEVLEVIAESGQKRYFLHSRVLTAYSKQPRIGVLRETPKKVGLSDQEISPEPPNSTTGVLRDTRATIDLSNWDGDTVGRFIQFLYAGDYILEPSEKQEAVEDEGQGVVDTPDKVQCLADQEQLAVPRTNIPLAHAKLYTLAYYKNVQPLEEMAFERLKKVLRDIDAPISKRTAENIIGLLDYVYTHTDPRAPISPERPIRGLVSTFAATHFEKLVEWGEMGIFLSNGGDFMAELMEMVGKEIHGIRGKLCDATKEVQMLNEQAAASNEKVKQLEAQLQQSETKLRQSEASEKQRVQQLESKVQTLESYIQQLGY